jgi:hypothetical protein
MPAHQRGRRQSAAGSDRITDFPCWARAAMPFLERCFTAIFEPPDDSI